MSLRPPRGADSSLKIALIGGHGRTGRAILAAAKDEDIEIVAVLGRNDDLAKGIMGADAVLDFSTVEATRSVVHHAVEQRKSLVIGTTGHSPEERRALCSTIADLPVVWSGNYSIGVNLVFKLTQLAGGMLGSDYDCEIVEAHHRYKMDAPSGTAATLLNIVRETRANGTWQNGRADAGVGPKGKEIGVHAVRGGDIVGDHVVVFAGAGERLELVHRASDRAIFARGALRAARWIRDRPAGLYSMQDVLWME